MKNAMQLKAIIKNLAKEKHISAQLVMQNFNEDLCQDTVKSNMAQTEIKESGEIPTNPDKSWVYKEF